MFEIAESQKVFYLFLILYLQLFFLREGEGVLAFTLIKTLESETSPHSVENLTIISMFSIRVHENLQLQQINYRYMYIWMAVCRLDFKSQ